MALFLFRMQNKRKSEKTKQNHVIRVMFFATLFAQSKFDFKGDQKKGTY